MFELTYYYLDDARKHVYNCDNASLDGVILGMLEDGVIKIELDGEVIFDET